MALLLFHANCLLRLGLCWHAAATDLRERRIPVQETAFCAVLSLLDGLTSGALSLRAVFSLLGWAAFLILFSWLAGRRLGCFAIGGGDIRLLLALALSFSSRDQNLFFLLFGFFALMKAAWGKEEKQIPLGDVIAAAASVMLPVSF